MIHTTEIIQSMIEFIQFDLYYTNPRAQTKKIVTIPQRAERSGYFTIFQVVLYLPTRYVFWTNKDTRHREARQSSKTIARFYPHPADW